MHQITHRIDTDATPAAARAAINTSAGIKAWWSLDCDVDESGAGGEHTLRFKKDDRNVTMRFRVDVDPNVWPHLHCRNSESALCQRSQYRQGSSNGCTQKSGEIRLRIQSHEATPRHRRRHASMGESRSTSIHPSSVTIRSDARGGQGRMSHLRLLRWAESSRAGAHQNQHAPTEAATRDRGLPRGCGTRSSPTSAPRTAAPPRQSP